MSRGCRALLLGCGTTKRYLLLLDLAQLAGHGVVVIDVLFLQWRFHHFTGWLLSTILLTRFLNVGPTICTTGREVTERMRDRGVLNAIFVADVSVALLLSKVLLADFLVDELLMLYVDVLNHELLPAEAFITNFALKFLRANFLAVFYAELSFELFEQWIF